MSRPICVHCGKAYGQRDTFTETVRWNTPTTSRMLPDPCQSGELRTIYTLDGDPKPPPQYRGNGTIIKERFAYLSADDGRMVMQRHIWDGESWYGGYDPFCTLRCALDYARKAYRARNPSP